MKTLRALLVHVYMFVSALSLVFLTQRDPLFLVGGSWLAPFGIILADKAPIPLALLALLWCMSFGVLLVISYILAWKERYLFFGIVTTIDTVMTLGVLLVVLINHNEHALSGAVWDGVVSSLYSALLITVMVFVNKLEFEDATDMLFVENKADRITTVV